MTHPPVEEPSQQRRAAIYGRANQASTHYRPLPKRGPVPAPGAGPGPTSHAAKVANRRRFVLFILALLVAIASGTAIVGVVLASPVPMAQAPRDAAPEMPEPAIQPLPPTGRAVPVQTVPRPKDKSGPPDTATTRRRTSTTKPAAGAGDAGVRPRTSASAAFQNCNKARRAGATPLYPGGPGYSARLDADGNGTACDEKEKRDKATRGTA